MKTYKFKIGNNPYTVDIESVEDGIAKVSVNGVAYEVAIEDDGSGNAAGNGAAAVSAASATAAASAPAAVAPAATGAASPAVAPASSSAAAAPAAGAGKKVTSPLPGVILSVNVAVGDAVKAGDKVAVLEAMKMENDIEAEFDGTVTAIHVQKGDSVLEGAAIVSLG